LEGFASLRKQQLNYSSIYLCASQSQGKHTPIDFMIQREDRSQSRFYICMNQTRTKQVLVLELKFAFPTAVYGERTIMLLDCRLRSE